MSLNPIDIPDTAQDHDASVDRTCDLSPTSPVDRQRMDRLMADRPSHKDLQSKGILKGEPRLQPSIIGLWVLVAAANTAGHPTGACFGAGDRRRLIVFPSHHPLCPHSTGS